MAKRLKLTKEQLIAYEHFWRRRQQLRLIILDMFTNPSRSWVEEMHAERPNEGEINTLWRHLMADEDKFHSYLRMGYQQFSILLRLVGPRVEKEGGVGRVPISARDRLVLTLR